MDLPDVIAGLDAIGAELTAVHGRLRYRGPKLAPADPLRAGLAEHGDALVRLLTRSPRLDESEQGGGTVVPTGRSRGLNVPEVRDGFGAPDAVLSTQEADAPSYARPPLTLDGLIGALRHLGASFYINSRGALRYVGPSLAPDDPIREAIGEHREMLRELFTYAPGGRCVSPDCYRLLAPGDKIACPDHR